MTSSKRLTISADVWSPDPLLSSKGHKASTPRYLRTQWDESTAKAFGPWRISEGADPTDAQTARAMTGSAQEDPAAVDPDAIALPLVEPSPTAEIAETVEAKLSEAALNTLREEAYQRGLQAGLEQAQQQIEEERHREREVLRHLTIELRSLNQDTQRFFEPLKKLSLHVAEQLVRGELQVSGHVVDTLIRQCLEQLDHPADKVLVDLSPADFSRLQAMGEQTTAGLELHSDDQLVDGSVRVRVNDTVVQDLIEHRLEPLARRLLQQPEAWLQKSNLLHPQRVEASDAGMSTREWGNRVVDVQDSEVKPTAEPEEAPGDAEDHDGL